MLHLRKMTDNSFTKLAYSYFTYPTYLSPVCPSYYRYIDSVRIVRSIIRLYLAKCRLRNSCGEVTTSFLKRRVRLSKGIKFTATPPSKSASKEKGRQRDSRITDEQCRTLKRSDTFHHKLPILRLRIAQMRERICRGDS
jgi:hypothetical protein